MLFRSVSQSRYAVHEVREGVRKVYSKEQIAEIDKINDVVKHFAELDDKGKLIKFKPNVDNKYKDLVNTLLEQRDEIKPSYEIVKAQIKDRRYSDMLLRNSRFTDEDYNIIRGYLINKGIDNANLDLYTKEMIAELTKMLKKEYNNMKFSSLNAIRSKNMKTGKLNKMSQREVVLSKVFNVVKEKINKSRVRNTISTDTAVNRIMRIIGDKINSVKAVKQIDVKNDMLTRIVTGKQIGRAHV